MVTSTKSALTALAMWKKRFTSLLKHNEINPLLKQMVKCEEKWGKQRDVPQSIQKPFYTQRELC